MNDHIDTQLSVFVTVTPRVNGCQQLCASSIVHSAQVCAGYSRPLGFDGNFKFIFPNSAKCIIEILIFNFVEFAVHVQM